MTATAEPLDIAWVDLGTSDPDRAAGFYSTLLAWAIDAVDDPAAGGYRLCRSAGALVAGLGPLTPGLQDRSWWDVHIGTADVDATAQRVGAAGGQVLAGPIDVLGQGRLSVCADPSGAQFRLLEGLSAELYNRPGSLCWVERVADDIAAFVEFCEKAFGWSAECTETADVALRSPEGASAIGVRAPLGPSESDVHWVPYFGVDDVGSAVARAVDAGAAIVQEGHAVPAGRAAVLADPTGAIAGVVAVASPPT